MPKKYPVEVRLFAVRKKVEGHSWDRVAEMLRQNFGLDSPPSRRQMTKWVKTRDALPSITLEQIRHQLPQFAPEWLAREQTTLLKMFTEMFMGKDFRIVMAKRMLSELKDMLGPERLRAVWAEFTEEEERLEKGGNAASDSLKLEEGGKNERLNSSKV